MSQALRSQQLDSRYQVTCLEAESDAHCSRLHATFVAAGHQLARAGLAPPSGGSLSIRLDHGFAVTCEGCHLPATRADEIVWVRECDIDQEIIRYVGITAPPADAILHHRILASRPDCGALVHAYTLTPASTRGRRGVRSIPAQLNGDRLALAHAVLEQIEIPRAPVVVGGQHYIAGGDRLADAVSAIVDLHRRLTAS
jgi:hypothetical protein